MKRLKRNTGFTLLEIIIVIIIIGVLASLAMPRFFRTVEYSRATEALANLSAMRQSMQRCFLQHNSYAAPFCDTLTRLDVDDPSADPTSHFTYNVQTVTANTFILRATRNALDGGTVGSFIQIAQDGVKSGTGAFAGIQ